MTNKTQRAREILAAQHQRDDHLRAESILMGSRDKRAVDAVETALIQRDLLAGQSVGDYVLVPREPTEAMLEAHLKQCLWNPGYDEEAQKEDQRSVLREAWSAMLSAAPAPKTVDRDANEALKRVRKLLRDLQPALNVMARDVLDDIIADQIDAVIGAPE